MSQTKSLYHIVFATKMRQPSIPLSDLKDLYRFIWKDTAEMKCTLKRIGGIQDHIHILVDLHPSVSLASYVKRVKGKSSGWLHADSRFPKFIGWCDGYFAATVSPEAEGRVFNYIRTQKEHHLGKTFDDELTQMCASAQLVLHPLDLR